MNFLEAIRTHALLFDGATGTMLKENGLLKPGDCPELFNVTRPMDILDLHLEYLSAGADVITANTFGANPFRLSTYGLAPRMDEIVESAIALAKEAVSAISRPAYVAASMGPTGLLTAADPRTGREIYDGYYAFCVCAAAQGADVLLIETISDLAEGRLALMAARAACNLPVLISFTLEPDDNTFAGNPPEVLAYCSAKLGAAMTGVNCGLGPKELFDGFSRLAAVSPMPVFAMPNAGMPDDTGNFSLSPDALAAALEPYLLGGAQAIGGCCGTMPGHIAALRPLVDRHQGCARARVLHEEYICSALMRLPLCVVDDVQKALLLDGMSAEEARACIISAAKDGVALELDFGALSPVAVRDLLWGVLPDIKKTPLIFGLHSAEQAKAALMQYPGIAAVHAMSDTYQVLKIANRFGAQVLV